MVKIIVALCFGNYCECGMLMAGSFGTRGRNQATIIANMHPIAISASRRPLLIMGVNSGLIDEKIRITARFMAAPGE